MRYLIFAVWIGLFPWSVFPCALECGDGPKPFKGTLRTPGNLTQIELPSRALGMALHEAAGNAWYQDDTQRVWKIDLATKTSKYQGKEEGRLLPVTDPKGKYIFMGSPLMVWNTHNNIRMTYRSIRDFLAVGMHKDWLFGIQGASGGFQSWAVEPSHGRIYQLCQLRDPGRTLRVGTGHAFPYAYLHKRVGKAIQLVRWNIRTCETKVEEAIRGIHSDLDWLHTFQFPDLFVLQVKNYNNLAVRRGDRCYCIAAKNDSLHILDSQDPLALGTEGGATFAYDLQKDEKTQLSGLQIQKVLAGWKTPTAYYLLPKDNTRQLSIFRPK